MAGAVKSLSTRIFICYHKYSVFLLCPPQVLYAVCMSLWSSDSGGHSVLLKDMRGKSSHYGSLIQFTTKRTCRWKHRPSILWLGHTYTSTSWKVPERNRYNVCSRWPYAGAITQRIKAHIKQLIQRTVSFWNRNRLVLPLPVDLSTGKTLIH